MWVCLVQWSVGTTPARLPRLVRGRRAKCESASRRILDGGLRSLIGPFDTPRKSNLQVLSREIVDNLELEVLVARN